MGATRDFVSATVADALLPAFRRPVEDIIYETLDRRQVPTRTDFKEMRDLLNNLRGQVSGASNGIRKVVERAEETEDILDQLDGKLGAIEERMGRLEQVVASAGQVAKRLSSLEAALLSAEAIEQKIDARLAAFKNTLPAAVSPEQLNAALGATVSLKQVDDRLAALKESLPAAVSAEQLDAALAAIPTGVTAEQLDAALAAIPAGVTAEQVADQVGARLAALPAYVTPAQLDERLAALAPAPAPEPAPEPTPAPAPVKAAPAPEPEEASDLCKVEGCNAKARARGFCARHYQRWRRGTLDEAFVDIQGNVAVGNVMVTIAPDFAGEPYRIEDGSVLVGDRAYPIPTEE